jgi:hypothetical protein
MRTRTRIRVGIRVGVRIRIGFSSIVSGTRVVRIRVRISIA